jgi:hypothetical protein
MVPGVGVAILKIWKKDSEGRPQQEIWKREGFGRTGTAIGNSLKITKKTRFGRN